MSHFSTLGTGFLRYLRLGHFDNRPWLDKRVMQPICYDAFSQMSYFQHADVEEFTSLRPDIVEIDTRSPNRLRIRYISDHENEYRLTANVQHPRKGKSQFGDSVYVEICSAKLDTELVGALEDIMHHAHIPVLTAKPEVLFQYENAIHLFRSPYFIAEAKNSD